MIFMDINDLVKESAKTWKHAKGANYTDQDVEILYVSNALGGEMGELQNKVKKYIRQKYWTTAHSTGSEKESINEEVADILFYVARLSELLSIDMEKEFKKKMEENVKRYGLAKA